MDLLSVDDSVELDEGIVEVTDEVEKLEVLLSIPDFGLEVGRAEPEMERDEARAVAKQRCERRMEGCRKWQANLDVEIAPK